MKPSEVWDAAQVLISEKALERFAAGQPLLVAYTQRGRAERRFEFISKPGRGDRNLAVYGREAEGGWDVISTSRPRPMRLQVTGAAG
jgi:hypothetical protein